MGSVINNIKCPNCKSEDCIDDFYYKSGEEYINCPECGYYRVFQYKRDDDGKFLRKDETKGYEFDNLIPEEIHLENPYGAYQIKNYGVPGYTGGSLENEEQLNELKKEIEQDDRIEYFHLSRFVYGEIKKEIIIDNGPENAV